MNIQLGVPPASEFAVPALPISRGCLKRKSAKPEKNNYFKSEQHLSNCRVDGEIEKELTKNNGPCSASIATDYPRKRIDLPMTGRIPPESLDDLNTKRKYQRTPKIVSESASMFTPEANASNLKTTETAPEFIRLFQILNNNMIGTNAGTLSRNDMPVGVISSAFTSQECTPANTKTNQILSSLVAQNTPEPTNVNNIYSFQNSQDEKNIKQLLAFLHGTSEPTLETINNPLFHMSPTSIQQFFTTFSALGNTTATNVLYSILINPKFKALPHSKPIYTNSSCPILQNYDEQSKIEENRKAIEHKQTLDALSIQMRILRENLEEGCFLLHDTFSSIKRRKRSVCIPIINDKLYVELNKPVAIPLFVKSKNWVFNKIIRDVYFLASAFLEKETNIIKTVEMFPELINDPGYGSVMALHKYYNLERSKYDDDTEEIEVLIKTLNFLYLHVDHKMLDGEAVIEFLFYVAAQKCVKSPAKTYPVLVRVLESYPLQIPLSEF